jgi:hypothetical protein
MLFVCALLTTIVAKIIRIIVGLFQSGNSGSCCGGFGLIYLPLNNGDEIHEKNSRIHLDRS